MCSVTVTGPVLSWLYDSNEDKWTEQLHYTSVRTHKNQSFSSHRPSNEKKNMFFIIPEMPSKTFVMVKKKLPDYFKTCFSMFDDTIKMLIHDFKIS